MFFIGGKENILSEKKYPYPNVIVLKEASNSIEKNINKIIKNCLLEFSVNSQTFHCRTMTTEII